jgi:putative SOS response-associated peptidase YedK
MQPAAAARPGVIGRRADVVVTKSGLHLRQAGAALDRVAPMGVPDDIEVFSFMTTLPNALTETINHERSPVILTEEEPFATWLRGTPEEAFGLIKTTDPERMQIVQSGLDKKDLLQAA